VSKIRHIAYRASDVEKMANFFVDALGMNITQRRKNRAIDLSDGTINITVLPLRGTANENQGIDHIGFSVENDDEAGRRLETAGAKKIATIELGSAAHYEAKFQGPEGIVVDIGKWIGTAPLREPS
jgi:catechol 2,3-dioxygenase-like lactoylglutathione lyase family enzyme